MQRLREAAAAQLSPSSPENEELPSTVQTGKLCNLRVATPAFLLPLQAAATGCIRANPGTVTAKSHGMGSIFPMIFKERSSAAPFSLLTCYSPSPPHPQRRKMQE